MRLNSTWFRKACLIFGLVSLLAARARCLENANATIPLFGDGVTVTDFPRLHTSLSTLLPHIVKMSPGRSRSLPDGSSKMLLVTLATPAFKHHLLNFLCFLHHRLATGSRSPGQYIVVTSSTKLAHWLADRGVVVLLLNRESAGQADPFVNLRLLDLLLDDRGDGANHTTSAKDVMLPWGTLHYQSLMLERTVAITTLVGLLAEVNQFPFENTTGPKDDPVTPKPPVIDPVGGVLLVDNDAVWYVLKLGIIP